MWLLRGDLLVLLCFAVGVAIAQFTWWMLERSEYRPLPNDKLEPLRHLAGTFLSILLITLPVLIMALDDRCLPFFEHCN